MNFAKLRYRRADRPRVNGSHFLTPGGSKTRRWNYIAICSGAICGNADRIDNLLTVRQTLSNYGNRAGKRLTVAVGITQTTVANTIQTGKKTADCLGRTGTDRRCKYIY